MPIAIELRNGDSLPKDEKGFWEEIVETSHNWMRPVVYQRAFEPLGLEDIKKALGPQLLDSNFEYRYCTKEYGNLYFNLDTGERKTESGPISNFLESEDISDAYMTLGSSPHSNNTGDSLDIGTGIIKKLNEYCVSKYPFFEYLQRDDVFSQGFLGRVGQSYVDPHDGATGSPWHACWHRNVFAQLAGTKFWEFMDRRADAAMGDSLYSQVFCAITTQTVVPGVATSGYTVQPGDFLVVPVGYWHKISNGPGLNVALPYKLEGTREAMLETIRVGLKNEENHDALKRIFLQDFKDFELKVPESLAHLERAPLLDALVESEENHSVYAENLDTLCVVDADPNIAPLLEFQQDRVREPAPDQQEPVTS